VRVAGALKRNGGGATKRLRRIAMRNTGSLPNDQRGAVAFEALLVYQFMLLILLLPMADLAVASIRFISGWEALRAFGNFVQYNPPADVTNPSWSPALPTSISGYPINKVKVFCGDTSNGVACTSSNIKTLPVKYIYYETTVTLEPMVLTSLLCVSSNVNKCTFTLSYSQRFQ
jgi:hypothetical protein